MNIPVRGAGGAGKSADGIDGNRTSLRTVRMVCLPITLNRISMMHPAKNRIGVLACVLLYYLDYRFM